MVKIYETNSSCTSVGCLVPPLNCAASTLWAAYLDIIPASVVLGSASPYRLFIRDFGLSVVPAIWSFVWSPCLFMGSFYMLARLYEPSAYRSLLDALLIMPVAKPPLQASAPSRKSTSALELPKSKRYCPGVVCGWHLGLTGNWLLLQSTFLLSACLCLSWSLIQGHQLQILLVSPLCGTNLAPWTCWWCLCKSTIVKQRFPFLTGFKCPLICMVVLVLCREPPREALSLYRGSWRRNKRFWLETSVRVNYLPQFLEQLSGTLGYFSKLTLNV